MFAAPTLTLGAAVLPRAPVRALRRNRTMAVATAEEQTTEAEEPAVPAGQAKVYVGKGRFIVDNPKKYPDRTILTGGFAGGEVGLKAFVAELGDGAKKVVKAEAKVTDASPKNKAKDALYVGKGRYLPFKPADNQARVIKSTGRDSTLTGGFTGGEVGLRKYVETGEVPFAPEGARGRQQQSPLIVAGVLSLSAVTGGILLNDIGEVGEQVVVGGGGGLTPAALAGLDENTKLLLETAVLLLGVLGTVVGGRALVGNLTSNLKDGAAKLATLAVFWVAVFVAARFILDS